MPIWPTVEALSSEFPDDTYSPAIWSESSMPWGGQSITEFNAVRLNTHDSIFESSDFTFPIDSSPPVLDDDANRALEVGLDERTSTRPDSLSAPTATIHLLENQSSFNGSFAPEPLLPTRNRQLWQSRQPVESYVAQNIPFIRFTDDSRRQSHKPRLLCPHHDCKSTFPRSYELQRHEKNVHYRTFSLLCPKYGCNRSSKPFGRLDKLKEHWRTHQRPDNFLCPVECCRAGPFSMADLRAHLLNGHSNVQLQQPDLDDLLCLLNLRMTKIGDGVIRLEERDVCPLAFLGCSFRSYNSDLWSLHCHIKEHELIQRVKGYNEIVAVWGYWSVYGVITCPVCNERVCGPNDGHNKFFRHVRSHSETERAQHAKELSEMLQPYLSGKETTCSPEVLEIFKEIREEVEGGFRASVSDVVQ